MDDIPTEVSKEVDSVFALESSNDNDSGDQTVSKRVLSEFVRTIDPRLLDVGWGFIPAKSVEHGKVDQPLVNHVRNAVFVLVQLNELLGEFDGYQLNEEELREVVALIIIHDVHKLAEAEGYWDEFELDIDHVDRIARELELTTFAPTLSTADNEEKSDFYACAVDHHDDFNAKPAMSKRQFNRHRPIIKLADGIASCTTPEEAANQRTREDFWDAYPESQELTLRAHTLDDVKGVFTNLLNKAVHDILRQEYGYHLLSIYQDGCVYLTKENIDSETASTPAVNENFVNLVYESLEKSVQNAHEAYSDPSALADNLAVRGAKGFYAINNQDFFYAGVETVLAAVTTKAFEDANSDRDPTDNMRETMEMLSGRLPIKIQSDNRVAAGYARLAYTVKRAFVDPVVQNTDIETDSLIATCRIFDLPQSVIDGLVKIQDDEELDLTAGGKWDYGYVIGQHIADRKSEENLTVTGITEWLIGGLSELNDDWSQIVLSEHTGELRHEIRTYIGDVIQIKETASTTQKDGLTDTFEEHHNKRRGKTCTFCNRGTTSTRKSDMEAPKSLTTFQAGYSNRIPAAGGKPDDLLVCIPCQIEFSLRETGTGWRDPDDDRLFVHLVPDYFYTPHMWDLYVDEILSRFTGEAMTRTGRLADAVFRTVNAHGHIDEDYISSTDVDWPEAADSFAEILREVTTDEGGRPMVESLSQGFEPEAQFGTQTLSYFKQQDNETEFQFFGVFVGLSVATAAGLRVCISQSPLPDVRGRDFPQMAKLDTGFTSVAEFYGDEIPLSQLDGRLGAAAALVQLGYEIKRDDARFAKYLRVARNKPLPGSYLLKRATQSSDDSNTAQFLLEETRFLDERNGSTNDKSNAIQSEADIDK